MDSDSLPLLTRRKKIKAGNLGHWDDLRRRDFSRKMIDVLIAGITEKRYAVIVKLLISI